MAKYPFPQYNITIEASTPELAQAQLEEEIKNGNVTEDPNYIPESTVQPAEEPMSTEETGENKKGKKQESNIE
jgi:hypothetical protein